MKRHPLRKISDLLFRIAMLPGLPLLIARPIARASSKFYYSI
jgi:hypothetical protein